MFRNDFEEQRAHSQMDKNIEKFNNQRQEAESGVGPFGELAQFSTGTFSKPSQNQILPTRENQSSLPSLVPDSNISNYFNNRSIEKYVL